MIDKCQGALDLQGNHNESRYTGIRNESSKKCLL